MAILEDIWNGFWDFANYVWCNGDLLAFLIVAAISVTAAIYVIYDRLPVHSVFYLALVFVTVAVTYFFLEAEFIGVVQLLVYVGAITILFGFSIMLTRRYIQEENYDDE